jgi:hypothetical protein
MVMKAWPWSLRFLWEEAPAMRLAGAGAREQATGVPLFLRKAVRWSALAMVGAALTGQIIGVRLIAPVDADCTAYTGSACRQCCYDTICAGKTGRAYLQCYASQAVADCCNKCTN